MLLFEMLFQKCDILESFIDFTRLTALFDEAFVLIEFLKLFFSNFSTMKYITEMRVRKDFTFVRSELVERLRNHNLI